MNHRHFNFIGLITTLIVIAIIAGMLFYIYSLSKSESGNPLTTPVQQENIFDNLKDIVFSKFNIKQKVLRGFFILLF